MNKSKVAIISILVVIFAAFLGLLTLNYDTNDDPLMLFISSGALNGLPDEHLQCIHLFLGMLLAHLYSVWPALPWYGMLLTAVHFLSVLAIVCAAVYKREVPVLHMLCFLLTLMLGYEALFLVKMQFTATAFLAGFAAVFMLLAHFPARVKSLLFLCFITVAFLLRREVFWPVMAFAAIALCWQYTRGQVRLGQVFVIGGLAVVLYGAAWWYNDRDPEYVASGYYPSHRATDIICNLPLDTSGNKLADYHWTANDLELLGFWFWVDKEVFAPQKLIGFAGAARTHRSVSETIRYGLRVVIEEKFAILIILIAAAFAGIAAADPRERQFLIGNILLTAGLLLYLIILARAPKRVSSPILFYAAVSSLFMIIAGKTMPRLRMFILVLVTLISMYKFWCVWEFSQEKKQKPPVFANAIRHINQHPDEKFIVVSKGLPLDLMPVFQQTKDLVPAHNLIFTGWLTYLPAYDRLLEANGLADLYTDIIGRNDLVLVNGNVRLREILETYYRAHYNTGISFEPYSPPFPDFPAYHIRFNHVPSPATMP